MTDLARPRPFTAAGLRRTAGRIDRVVAALVLLFAGLAVAAPSQVLPSLRFTGESLIGIAPFLALSVAIAAGARASGADAAIARVFTGRPVRMIVTAAAFGALSPFCSCGVIPVVAGLLGAGVPLAPVMAFWVSSPIMDPEMFVLMVAALGLPFTLAKTAAAIGVGLLAGFVVLALQRAGRLAEPLRAGSTGGCCAGGSCSTTPEIRWAFWRDPTRRTSFARAAGEAGWFLGKWLTLAFAIESLMAAWIPGDAIAAWLGGGNWWTIPAAVAAGVPAYLNGYAAIPLIARLMDMGMAPGAALAFLVAGGITSIPAAIAVWVMVRRGVFAWYLAIAGAGSLAAGFAWQALAG